MTRGPRDPWPEQPAIRHTLVKPGEARGGLAWRAADTCTYTGGRTGGAIATGDAVEGVARESVGQRRGEKSSPELDGSRDARPCSKSDHALTHFDRSVYVLARRYSRAVEGEPPTMTRSILAVFAVAVFLAVIEGTGCQATGVGDPCTPEQEYHTSFAGFDEKEVNVESKSFQCQTRLCLVNHFRGRVSCAYGQNGRQRDCERRAVFDHDARSARRPCSVPGDPSLLIDPTKDDNGNPIVPAPKAGHSVPPSAPTARPTRPSTARAAAPTSTARRTTAPTTASARTAYACTQLVTSIGAGDTGLTGAYCIKNNTAYDSNAACAQSCDPMVNSCPALY